MQFRKAGWTNVSIKCLIAKNLFCHLQFTMFPVNVLEIYLRLVSYYDRTLVWPLYILNKKTAMMQTSPNAYLWMKTSDFDSNFSEVCGLESNRQYRSICSGYDLGRNSDKSLAEPMVTELTEVFMRLQALMG